MQCHPVGSCNARTRGALFTSTPSPPGVSLNDIDFELESTFVCRPCPEEGGDANMESLGASVRLHEW